MERSYHGKILHVDLTGGRTWVETPPESFYRKYMGGSALGLYYALKEIPVGADPLGPDNVLVLSLSVVTGLPISGQSRATATAKSPLTGAIGDGQAGGFWPAEAKAAGYDAIVMKGRAPKPVYLWIHDGQAELRDASHLWGKITGEAEALIRQELGDKRIEVLQIGPAGEQLVRFACLINMANRANGRTGLGAVMGSKNLKAVAVRGKDRPRAADPEALQRLAKWGAQNIDRTMGTFPLYGTAETVGLQQASGGLPTYNFRQGVFDRFQDIDGVTMYDTILVKRDTCFACAVRCKRVVDIQGKGFEVDPLYGGPEYETLAMFGSNCGIADLAAISKANELCNKYGLDTISCGGTIAWAMECFEKGLLTAEDTGGLELRFGNVEAMVEAVKLIATRQGIGDLLAEGSVRAARKLGRGSERFLVAARGQEYPAHMPATKRTLGVIYSVNPFGADHMSHEHDPEIEGEGPAHERLTRFGILNRIPMHDMGPDKIRFALYTQYMYSLADSLDVCQFVWGPASWSPFGPDEYIEFVRAATGWPVSLFELIKVGERRLNMMQAFNAREGLAAPDTLPPRMFEPLSGGPSDGWALDPEEMKQAFRTYLSMAGWDVETGAPTRGKLEELGLGWIAGRTG
jgi:aldehyde:ferredoxin oxidoreductase